VTDFKELLSHTLSLRIKRNPSYSLRALARDLNISPSSLSEILKGKYLPSGKTISRVAMRLNLSQATIDQLMRDATTSADAPHCYEYDRSQFSLISQWYYLAIMALMEQGLFIDEASKVSDALGIPKSEATKAIAQLCEMDLIRQDLEGRLTTRFQTSFVPDGTAPHQMREFHFQVLAMAKEALKYVPRSERFFETRFVHLSEEGFNEAQEILREAGQKIDQLNSKYANPTKVCNISWQLFPANGKMRETYAHKNGVAPSVPLTTTSNPVEDNDRDYH
jgi:DNA-binding MarR family transcriptional regulator